jgi:hypothetical protein
MFHVKHAGDQAATGSRAETQLFLAAYRLAVYNPEYHVE